MKAEGIICFQGKDKPRHTSDESRDSDGAIALMRGRVSYISEIGLKTNIQCFPGRIVILRQLAYQINSPIYSLPDMFIKHDYFTTFLDYGGSLKRAGWLSLIRFDWH